MRYWVYLKGEVPGGFEAEELAALPGFEPATLVCPAEGEILERNWRRAGEFDDLSRVLEARADKTAASAPTVELPAPPLPGDANAFLEGTGARLFSHVASLMKELESRREDRALALSLRRQITALKEDLAALRERAASAESRLPRLQELEDALRRAQSDIATLREEIAARDAAAAETRMAAERTRLELEESKRRLAETSEDLAIRNRLVEKLSRELSEKGLTLANSLALIRRLEEDLHRLDGTAPEPRPAPEEPVVVPLSSEEPAAPEPAPPPIFTVDEPAPAPGDLEPAPQDAGALQTLRTLLRRVFPGLDR